MPAAWYNLFLQSDGAEMDFYAISKTIEVARQYAWRLTAVGAAAAL